MQVSDRSAFQAEGPFFAAARSPRWWCRFKPHCTSDLPSTHPSLPCGGLTRSGRILMLQIRRTENTTDGGTTPLSNKGFLECTESLGRVRRRAILPMGRPDHTDGRHNSDSEMTRALSCCGVVCYGGMVCQRVRDKPRTHLEISAEKFSASQRPLSYDNTVTHEKCSSQTHASTTVSAPCCEDSDARANGAVVPVQPT